MKLTKVLLASSLVLFGLTGCVGNNTAIIKVNDSVITKGEYQEAFNKELKSPQYGQFAEMLKDETNIMSLMVKDRIVNELILKSIISQEVKKHNIEVTNDEVEKRENELIEKLGSKDKFEALLKKNGVTEKQLKKDIKNELEVDKLIEAIGAKKVTDKEIKDFYNKNKATFNYPERVRASHILIEVNPGAIKQEIISKDKAGKLTSEEISKKTQEEVDKKMERAKEIRAKVAANPKDFAKLAKQYSEDTASADMGGDLGFFSREDMVKPFADTAFKLKPGTISEIVVTDYGNHIILVTDKAKAGLQPYEKVKDEIKAYLEQKNKIEVLKNLLNGLKSTAKVEYIDQSYNPKNIQQKIQEENKKQQESFKEIQQEAVKSGEIITPKDKQNKK